MLISENTLLFGDISAFQTSNCQKPVDTPLRGNVPRSALTVAVAIDDGSVTMEIQGTEENIDRVILAVEAGRYVRIEKLA